MCFLQRLTIKSFNISVYLHSGNEIKSQYFVMLHFYVTTMMALVVRYVLSACHQK